jgi:hypothetical protein
MSFCPRCTQPVPTGAGSCPQCDYDISAIDPSTTETTPGFDRRGPPPETLLQAAPWSPLDTWNDHETVTPAQGNRRPPRHKPDWHRLLRSKLPIIAAAVIIAITAAMVVVPQPGDHGDIIAIPGIGSPAKANASRVSQATENGQQQATVIDRYLKQSATARAGVSDAIGSIAECRNIANAVATLSNAADTRARILTDLTHAQVTALPAGTTMLADLQQALRASATADRDYAAWGTATETACTGKATHTASFTAAQQSDATATAAKQRFVQNWNTTAVQFGFPPQNASTI